MHLDTDDKLWTKEDTLWNRVVTRAEQEKSSYWAVCRQVITEYWKDNGLDKDPEWSKSWPERVYWKEEE
jgi:hypothetical protein